MSALWKNRRLVAKLAKNDFKKRYAGSYMGVIWTLLQPIVTVVLYYFVFDVVFDNRPLLLANGINAPYVLWLTAGLVPWLYFSEAVMQGMNAFLEYSYLVKKVVFQIDILPAIKLVASSFVHVFFAAVLVVMYLVYGMKPDIYLLQLPYYSLCMFVFLLALSYATASIVVFFRDLSQIVSIFLQVLMWATPIMWDISFISGHGQLFTILFKCNPIFYVVSGYRDALFMKQWFWESPILTLYFWGVTLALFLFGKFIYKRLEPHFADVL